MEYRAYIVKFSYQKSDGTWIENMYKEVIVPNDKIYKANHGEVNKVIRDEYKGCIIHSVVYA